MLRQSYIDTEMSQTVRVGAHSAAISLAPTIIDKAYADARLYRSVGAAASDNCRKSWAPLAYDIPPPAAFLVLIYAQRARQFLFYTCRPHLGRDDLSIISRIIALAQFEIF